MNKEEVVEDLVLKYSSNRLHVVNFGYHENIFSKKSNRITDTSPQVHVTLFTLVTSAV